MIDLTPARKGAPHMLIPSMEDTVRKQFELLSDLDDITIQQEAALDAGDLAALNRLSEQRARLVSDAAPFVPPALDWDPKVHDLALRVRDRSNTLQRAMRDCMASLRNELVALTDRQRISGYYAARAPRRGVTWQV